MKHAHLKLIDDKPLAVEAVQLWAEQSFDLVHVQNSENFVYRFGIDVPPGCYYLRLTHSEHRNHGQLLAELNFVLHLEQAGCRVSRPLLSLQGNLVEPLLRNGTLLHACVFEAASGARVDGNLAAWDQKSLFEEWGRSLGSIHAASKSFHPSNFRRLRWNEDDILLNASIYLPTEETAARKELEKVLNWLETLPEDEERFGLIHGDLCCANFHYDGQHITSFDFDDSTYHWFVYDLVCALAPMVFHPRRELYRQWVIEGYQRVNSLPETWQEDFDWFLRLRGLYLFILNLRNWDGPIAQHPKSDFLNILRHSFERIECW